MMAAQLYNFRGDFQLVDIPDQPAARRPLPAVPSHIGQPRREVLPYANEDQAVRLLGSPVRVAAEVARLQAAGVLLYASALKPMADRGDRRVIVDVKLREYPRAAVAPVAHRGPSRRRRVALIAAALVATVAALLGLAYAVSAAVREVWELLVSLAPVLGGLAVVLFVIWLRSGGRGCPGAHCPGGH
jgi:hypothetical protein